MLKDLEKRDAFLEENSDQVLDGLYSAYDIELKNKKSSYHFLFFIICLILLISLLIINFSFIEEKFSHITSEYSEIIKNNKELISIKSKVTKENINTNVLIEKQELEKEEVVKSNSEVLVKKETNKPIQYKTLKLDEDIFLSEKKLSNKKLNRIESIQFEIDDTGINLIMKMPEEIDYLVYGLNNPDRTVIEVKNAKLGFKIEDLAPVEPIVAIRYSINSENRFKLVLESESPLLIKKSVTTKSENDNDLIVMMEHQWQKQQNTKKKEDELVAIVDQQVELEKDVVFKGDLIKIPVNNGSDAYAEKLFQEAFVSYKKGNTSESLKKLNIVLNHEPGHTKARSTLALALSDKDHYELAYSVLNEGLIQYPENTEWLTVYARLLLSQGKFVEASQKLAKLKPELAYNTEYYALQAAVLQKLEQHNQAAVIYRDLLHVNPLKAVWWMGLGISLESMKRYDDALYAYQKASSNRKLANDSRQFIIQRITRITNLLKDESS